MNILKYLKNLSPLEQIESFAEKTFDGFSLPENRVSEIKSFLNEHYAKNKDPWGLDIDKICFYMQILYPLYEYYFRIRTIKHGHQENDVPSIFVANHTGQVAFDGMLLSMAGLLEFDPPRLLRGMVERWMVTLPYIAKFAATAGSILGDRQNCEYLLQKGESIMVFPEGVTGIAKNTRDFYKMTSFTNGFFRMAMKTNTPLVPVAIIGAEEAYPLVYHIRPLAKLLGLPALPLTPLMVLPLPFGIIPLPSPIDIHIGEPYYIPKDLDPHITGEELFPYVEEFREKIHALLINGLRNRRPFFEKVGLKDIREI